MPDHAGQAARLARNAVDVLPQGALADQLDEGRPLRVKLGIDPTAPDIHLGHTVVLTKLREFQEAGHTVVLIIGDFTARVGDPSGRSAQRPVLEPEEIDANAKTFTEQAFKVLDPEGTEVRFNSEWLRMPAEELFGLLGQATVAQIIERDDFSKRLAAGTPISLLELLYPVLQGYDSVAVKADVELGGTDQKFNLLLARDIQSAQGMKPQSVLTMPILPGIDGVQRMSKSAGNYVGVTDPPEEMFGKLMRIPDSAMPEYYAPAGRAGGGGDRLGGAAGQRGQAAARADDRRALLGPGWRRRGPRSTSTGSSCATSRRPRWRRWWCRAGTGASTCRRCWPTDSASAAARRGGCWGRAGSSWTASRWGPRRWISIPPGWTVRSSRSASGATSA